MRTIRTAFLMVTIAALLVAAAPPATTQVSLAEMEPLADGQVRYVPPAGWELVSKTPDQLQAIYKSSDPPGAILVDVTLETRAIQPASKDQMALIIGKGIRDAAAREGQQIVVQPRVEQDERYFLKIHDAIKAEGRISDRLQMYRIMGLNLVHVAVTANVDSLEQSKPVFETAEKLLDGMKLSRGSKRSVYPRAQLRAVVPTDWRETKFDQPNGVVAAYIDPKRPARRITLQARIIPAAARDDEEKGKAFLAKMVDADRVKNATEEEVPPPKGSRYVRHMRWTTREQPPRQIESRYLIVKDVLVSVVSTASAGDEEAMSAIADRFALTVKPSSDPP